MPMSFFLTEFTQYKNKISKEGLSKVAEMPKAPKNCIIAQAKKEFTKHLLHINKQDMFNFVTRRISKASRKLKRLKDPNRNTPAEIIKKNEKNRHKIVTFNVKNAAKKVKQSL